MKSAQTIRKVLVLSVLLIFVTSACRKTKISDTEYSEFIGTWYATEGTLSAIEFDIQHEFATWVKFDGIVTTNVDGVPKISSKRDKLKLTIKKFDIDVYPAEIDGTWTMVLDGITYEKY